MWVKGSVGHIVEERQEENTSARVVCVLAKERRVRELSACGAYVFAQTCLTDTGLIIIMDPNHGNGTEFLQPDWDPNIATVCLVRLF